MLHRKMLQTDTLKANENAREKTDRTRIEREDRFSHIFAHSIGALTAHPVARADAKMDCARIE